MKTLFLTLLFLLSMHVQAAQLGSFVNEIKTSSTFEGLGNDPGGVVQTGQVIKFLIDNRSYPNGKVYFINSNYCEGSDCPVKWVALHYDFATKKVPDFHFAKPDFEDSVYYQPEAKNKKFIAGRVQTFVYEQDGQKTPFYGIWFFERDRLV